MDQLKESLLSFEYLQRPVWVKFTEKGIKNYIKFYKAVYGFKMLNSEREAGNEDIFHANWNMWKKMSITKLDLIFDNQSLNFNEVRYSDPNPPVDRQASYYMRKKAEKKAENPDKMTKVPEEITRKMPWKE